MRPNIILAPAALLCVCSSFSCDAQQRGTKSVLMYFLREDNTGTWCGYVSKEDWTRESRRVVVGMMGYVEEFGGSREVNLRQQDSTADWILDDTYSLDTAGQIKRLRRTVVYFSDDERKETIYEIQGGHATVRQTAAFNLRTKAPLRLPLPMDQYESWPLFTRSEDFPFKDLLKDSAKILKAGTYCTTGPVP